MFSDYELFESIKLRQEEVNKKARNAWKFYERTDMKKKTSLNHKEVQSIPCCQCA